MLFYLHGELIIPLLFLLIVFIPAIIVCFVFLVFHLIFKEKSGKKNKNL